MNPKLPNKIMLVEDDPTMRNLLKTLLELEGYQVTVYSEMPVDSIIPEFQATHPDVLLMDVHLRSSSGLEVLTMLRSFEPAKALPVLMTSGSDVRDNCFKLGATGFLLKPYMPDDLIGWIKQQKS